MQQAYLEVKDTATQKVVTVLEVLSPANKRGEGRSKYEAKRQQILRSQTNLVEIDLLRGGQPFLMEPEVAQSHYRMLVSRAQQRPLADLYPFNLADDIPTIPLPLGPEDGEVALAIQPLLNELYDQLGYDYFIDYGQAPPAPWSLADMEPYLQK